MKNISLGGASPPTSPRGSDSESDSEERMQYARDVAERNVRLDKHKAEMAAEKAKAAADKKAAAEKAARDQKSQREKDHKKKPPTVRFKDPSSGDESPGKSRKKSSSHGGKRKKTQKKKHFPKRRTSKRR
jgi:hypothetical protein